MTYTDQELLNIIVSLADEVGGEPSISDLHDREELPYQSTYCDRFDSWVTAKREAGVLDNPDWPSKKEIPRAIKKERSCIVCGESATAALVFHHPKDVDKVDNVPALTRSGKYDREDILNEIDKCIVACRNCHGRHHSNHDALTIDP
jgi:hypothetical protein